MKCTRPWQAFLALGAISFASGCLFTSKASLNNAEAQSRILSQQNAAQLTEIENLRSHGNDLEGKLTRSEEQIALLKEQVDLDRRQMASYEREHSELYEQFKALARQSAKTSAQPIAPQQTGDTNARAVR